MWSKLKKICVNNRKTIFLWVCIIVILDLTCIERNGRKIVRVDLHKSNGWYIHY
jgi:hypothetical protein